MKFKIGDRVRVYVTDEEYVGTVVKIINGIFLNVATKDNLNPFVAHYKQCRKLVKEPRKIVWIPKESQFLYPSTTSREEVIDWLYKKPYKGVMSNFIEFVEVRKPKNA